MLRAMLFFVALLGAAGASAKADVSIWPVRVREAGAAAAWQRVTALQSNGTLAVGGMQGEFESLEDARDGRSKSRYLLGPMEGGQGYDGQASWSRTGPETVVADSPQAKANAATSAWISRRGYFSDEGARYGVPEARSDAGVDYVVVSATPDGGAPIELWFDAGTALLARTVQRIGQDRQAMRFEDYRDVAGVPVPFRVINEGNDPRNRTVIEYASVQALKDIAADAFALPSTAAQDYSFTDGGTSAVLKFDLLNNHIYVDGAIDGKPVRLLFDTGGLNLLTPQAAQRLGLKSEGNMAARGVGEAQVDLAFARAGRLELGTLRMDAPLFYVMDLGDLPKVEGFAFDGLVGYEIFHRLGVQIDYARATMTLTHPDRYRAPPDAVALDFTLDGRIPVVQGEIDGLPARISIDTGSRASISLHSPFVREHKLLERFHACFEAVTGWGVGGAARGSPARLPSLRLGTAEVSDVLADLVTSDKGAFADPDISANVGSGLLRRFVVDFDYRARKMYLAPGPDHDYRDNYDRAGMWLMLDGDALRVAAVTPGGAAERAGVKPEDRIVKIEGADIASRNLPAWRALLRDTAEDARVAMRLERDGKEQGVLLRLKDPIEDCAPTLDL
jgi:predicted aspartyl protease